MHIYFSGIGGTAIGPLALIAKQAGYSVSGSDKQGSQYIDYLAKHGITDVQLDQSYAAISAAHARRPIDWLVYTSALPLENPDAPELKFCQEHGIRATKRDALLNQILTDTGQKLVAIAGTHGKSTTTAMAIWLFKELGLPASYNVGAKISFGDMGEFDPNAQHFVYECDEFDRNFLQFNPSLSLISGVTWDHHEIFPTREDYQQAFRDFIGQSDSTVLWQGDADYLSLSASDQLRILAEDDPVLAQLTLDGEFNRRDALLAMQAVRGLGDWPLKNLVAIMNRFPGSQRRMELIAPGLYSDYAHTPEKIGGAMSVAREMAARAGQKLVVVYEPLTNRRQHFMIDDYKDCFSGADHVYWLPSYLAREDPTQRIIEPGELISHLSEPSVASPAATGPQLKAAVQKHLDAGDMVVGMAGGGGASLDEWLRAEFAS